MGSPEAGRSTALTTSTSPTTFRKRAAVDASLLRRVLEKVVPAKDRELPLWLEEEEEHLEQSALVQRLEHCVLENTTQNQEDLGLTVPFSLFFPFS